MYIIIYTTDKDASFHYFPPSTLIASRRSWMMITFDSLHLIMNSLFYCVQYSIWSTINMRTSGLTFFLLYMLVFVHSTQCRPLDSSNSTSKYWQDFLFDSINNWLIGVTPKSVDNRFLIKVRRFCPEGTMFDGHMCVLTFTLD